MKGNIVQTRIAEDKTNENMKYMYVGQTVWIQTEN